MGGRGPNRAWTAWASSAGSPLSGPPRGAQVSDRVRKGAVANSPSTTTLIRKPGPEAGTARRRTRPPRSVLAIPPPVRLHIHRQGQAGAHDRQEHEAWSYP